MSGFNKDRIKKAIENFHIRQEEKDKGLSAPTRKNESPEKDLVEKPCLAWMKSQGWDVQIYEAKNQFVNGRWQAAGMKAGTCDCQGITDEGIAVFVEFKAPGKRSSFNRANNQRQRDYLVSKINHHAFAVVVDSLELLIKVYNEWCQLRVARGVVARDYLLSALPQQKTKPQGSDALGF